MKANEYNGSLEEFLQKYNYQPELTSKLDDLGNEVITQEILNEIVLWKVDRYVKLNDNMMALYNQIKFITKGNHRESKDILKLLLNTHGVDLAMASTLLRFRNPEVFQIIDRHAYRAIYDQDYPLYAGSPINNKLDLYYEYIDKLIILCEEKELDFKNIDRLLYIFDKEVNGKL